ncbi:MAG TPA: ABC transporter permease, partial [Candidatus Polarisedimenticolaceae bacterium]|nr:ABC transporter permease [Candidatus Polarisedimenticolaceae bacterium]
MTQLVQDLRFAVRTLAKSPGPTLLALAALALGIGANSAIYSVVDAVLLHPLEFREPQRLVVAYQFRAGDDLEALSISPDNFADLREQARSFERIAAYQWWDVNLTGTGTPERLQGFLVSPDLFPLLGVQAALGRSFRPEAERRGHDEVALLSDGLWRRSFAADPAVIGRTLLLNGKPHTIVGVMPPGFAFPLGGPEVWVPLTLEASLSNRGSRSLRTVGRLAPGVTPAQAGAEVAAL